MPQTALSRQHHAAPTVGTSSTCNAWNEPRPVDDGTERMLSAVDRLYSRFDAMYMQKFKSNFTTPDAVDGWKAAWSDALSRSGVTIRMAFDGVQKCATEFMWPPSLPEFLALCRPPLDYEQSFLFAVRQMHKRQGDGEDHWPVPAVYWAAVDFGTYDLRVQSYSQAASRWKKALDKRLQGECPAVPVFALQLAAPALNAEGAAITSAEAKAEAMRAMANLAFKKPSRDIALARAQAVLAKQAAGEYVQPYQLTHAREVLARLAADPGDDDDEPIT